MKKKGLYRMTGLLIVLCIFMGMLGLSMAAYAEELSEEEIVAADKAALEIGFVDGDSENSVTKELSLPLVGIKGSTIAWSSDKPNVISDDGKVTSPSAQTEDTEVVLVAVISYGNATDTKEFRVHVLKEQADVLEQPIGDGGEPEPGLLDDNGEEPGEDVLQDKGTQGSGSQNGLSAGSFDLLSMGVMEEQGDLTIVTMADKYVYTYQGQNKAFGVDPDKECLVGYDEYIGRDMKSFMKFDLQQIDTIKLIEKVELQLHIHKFGAYDGKVNTYYLYGTGNNSWTENNIYEIPGGTHVPIWNGTVGYADVNKWKSFDVTDFIKESGNATVTLLLTGDQYMGSDPPDYSNYFAFRDRVYNNGSYAARLQVTYANENISLSKNAVKEGLPPGTLVGTLGVINTTLTEPYTYSIISGNEDFVISGNQLLTKKVFDYNTKSTYEIVIGVTDSEVITLDDRFTIDIIEAQKPTGSIQINSGSNSTGNRGVTLNITASDPEGTSIQMRFSNDGTVWSEWEASSSEKLWTLTDGDGTKTVYMQLKNELGKTASFSDTIVLKVGGDGSEGNPFKVGTPEQLKAVQNNLNWHYIQTADINLSGEINWMPLGWDYLNNPFTGSYNGNGYSISNLKINNNTLNCIGLFGAVGGTGRLEDIHLTDIDVKSFKDGSSVGGLVGYIKKEGTVIGCSSSGSVTARNTNLTGFVGGLVGDVASGGTVSRSRSSGCVTGESDEYAGGLIGRNSGTISQCCSDSHVTVGNSGRGGGLVGQSSSEMNGTTPAIIQNSRSSGDVAGGSSAKVGGLVGVLDDWEEKGVQVEYCYSSGSVTVSSGWKGGLVGVKQYENGNIIIVNSYFDSSKAGTVSAGGTPLTTEQMKNQSNYSGWDFDTIWKSTENSYPILVWEGINAVIAMDRNALTWDIIKGSNDTENNVTTNLSPLPTSGENGTTISWSVSPAGWINTTTGEVQRPAYSLEDKTVTLTAIISKVGGTSQRKEFTLTIKKKDPKVLTVVNVEAQDKVYDGNTVAVITGAQLTGVAPGDIVYLINHATGTFAQSNAGTGITVTTNMSLAGDDAGEYILNQPSGLTADITARPLTVTADAVSKTYGDDDPEFTYQIPPGSLVGGDSFTGGLTREVGGDVGTYEIQQGSLIAGSNYEINFESANLTIIKKALTVTADNKSKVYDGEVYSDFTVRYAGFIEGEDGSVLSGTLAFTGIGTTAKDAGHYTVTPGGLTSGNYNITFVDGSLEITKRDITVTADGTTKTYGDEDPELTYRITSGSLVGSDSLEGGLSREAGENAGTYQIQQGTLTAGSNYEINFESANLTINKRDLTVTADAVSKIYGDADPSFTYEISSGSLVGSDTFSGALTRVAGENAGTYEIQRGTLAAGNNYNLTYLPAILTITKRDLTVTADTKMKTYGDTDPELTYRITSGSLVGSDSLGGGLSREAGENAGTYEILKNSLTAGDNYNFNYISAELTINKRELTITADAKSKTYGDDDPEFTYQITSGSLVGSDALSGGLTCTAGGDVGIYEIQQGSLTAGDNYNLIYVPVNLTVNKKVLTVTADTKSKVYDGEVYSDFTVTYAGFVGEENQSVLSGTLTFSGTAVTATAAGHYTITPEGLTSGNYDITFVDGSLEITKRVLTITANGTTKTYGDEDPEFTYRITSGSLVGSDVLSGGLTCTAGGDVGIYEIQQGSLTAGDNYDITYEPANLTITYIVTYNSSGGTGTAPEAINMPAAGETFTAADNSFTPPSGRQFKEWNTEADGTGTGYAAGATVTMPARNLTLYAIWQGIPETGTGSSYNSTEETIRQAAANGQGYVNVPVAGGGTLTLNSQNLSQINGSNITLNLQYPEVEIGINPNSLPIPQSGGSIQINAVPVTDPDTLNTLYVMAPDGRGVGAGYSITINEVVNGQSNSITQLGGEINLTFQLDEEDLEGIDPASLRVYKLDEATGNLVELGGEYQEGTISVSTSHLCKFVIMGKVLKERIFGDDRYATAAAISKKGWEKSDNVIIAYGEDYPDALTGVALAGLKDAPILLTMKHSLNEYTLKEIERLGAKNIYIIGGTGVISESVELQLKENYNVGRIEGSDRYKTAAAVGQKVKAEKNFDTVIITTGLDFPDAMAITPFAAKEGTPILYTSKDTLNEDTEKALKDWGIKKVIIAGGPGVVSNNIEEYIKNKMGIEVKRIYGTDRYLTSLEIAKYYGADYDYKSIVISTGEIFADALCGAPFAAKGMYPVILAGRNDINKDIPDYVGDLKIDRVYILGGPGAVSDEVKEKIH